MHFFATLMVALGSTFSAVWIVVANSWQQTPAGFQLVERDPATGEIIREIANEVFNPAMAAELPIRAEITDFWELVFNPSSVIRLVHVILGAYLAGSFLMMSVSSWYILKGRHLEFAKRCFKLGLIVAAISSLLQLAAGSISAEVVAEHQPAKLAAFEGIYETEESTPFYVFGAPDTKNEKVLGLAIPGGLSFLVHRA